MLARVQSYLLQGVDALPCEVEVDIDDTDMDRQTVVGLPDAAVKEALERVRAALGNSGYGWPGGKIVINLAPADVRKEGPVYDLPIAVGLLIAQGVIPQMSARKASAGGSGGGIGAPATPGLDHRRFIFGGEVALDGRIRPIKGAIALAALAQELRCLGVVLPADNAQEASVVAGSGAGAVEVFGVRTLAEVVGLMNGTLELPPHPPTDVAGLLSQATAPIDFVEIRGQEGVKRAIVIAAAGSHNIVRLCPSGGDGENWRCGVPVG